MTPDQFTDRVFLLARENGWVTPRDVIICPHSKTLNREKVRALFVLSTRRNFPPAAADTAALKSLKIQPCCFERLRELAVTAYNQ